MRTKSDFSEGNLSRFFRVKNYPLFLNFFLNALIKCNESFRVASSGQIAVAAFSIVSLRGSKIAATARGIASIFKLTFFAGVDFLFKVWGFHFRLNRNNKITVQLPCEICNW